MLGREEYENVVGIDVSEEAIRLCRSKGISKVVRMEGSDLGFKENVFDLVIASDVLEHILDDFKALCEWKRVLKKGGDIVAFVPAFKSLWSGHDVVNRHFRRYNKSELQTLLIKSKLSIIRMSYWNFFLFLPISFRRLIEKRRAKSPKSRNDLFRCNPAVNFFLSLILRVENIYCRFFNMPLGLSLFVIAKK